MGVRVWWKTMGFIKVTARTAQEGTYLVLTNMGKTLLF